MRFADKTCLLCLFGSVALAAVPATEPATQTSLDDRFSVGEVLLSDDFDHDLSNWSTELQQGGVVGTRDAALVIDVPAGCTVWLKRRFAGPLMIQYEATVIRAGGANDRVSDLNCFWMARDHPQIYF